ncbi:DUF397 domain-containing protein [Lentzea sp. JNUCC 0626]|uniref:DUF397 domain-containing protein n=1 Tax=Lentzea sp. JNUCC 0626 TaxID=3367513 RepID=UPI003748CDA8
MNDPTVSSDISFTPWFKSSYSQPKESACVEVRFGPAQAQVRDSKAPQEGRLPFSGCAWTQFRMWAVNGGPSDAAAL